MKSLIPVTEKLFNKISDGIQFFSQNSTALNMYFLHAFQDFCIYYLILSYLLYKCVMFWYKCGWGHP